MPLKHAPRLVELAIGGYYCYYILQSFCKFSRYLYQIDTLTLHENMLKILEVPVLTNLKQLKFIADVIDRDPTLLAITSLIEAASFLQRFILQVSQKLKMFCLGWRILYESFIDSVFSCFRYLCLSSLHLEKRTN